jgi:serine/threonine protein kinase
MPLVIGQQLGSYEITALLGKGGMGEVYRARDAKLKREVAIKVLPEDLSRDFARASRFQREAEVLASLSHPNIAAIYDLQEAGETRFLILELVEGETLADRIARAPIPLDDALLIAKQIAEALEAAHERGVIHRDLKPANVKLKPDGSVKVLDFGLAKIHESDVHTASLSNSPTLMTASSVPGVILGTAAYMSPEQAKGKEVDRTTDVWAFGCVLYEMLAGRPAFEGETLGEILAGVLKDEPDWRRLPLETPEAIRRLLRRCLKKDRKQRLPHIGAARIEIDEAQSEPASSALLVAKAPRRAERFLWISALAAVALIGAAAVLWTRKPEEQLPQQRLEITTPPTTDPLSIAISPDGTKVVFSASTDGRSRLWLRALDSVSSKSLAGTEGASFPFWSPDSRSLGFFADNKLKRIDIDGVSVQTLANSIGSAGGAWGRDGTILFNPLRLAPVFRVPASGGNPVAVTRLEGQAQGHRNPQFLPDGRHFLYYVPVSSERGIYVTQLDGSDTRRLLDADPPAFVLPSGQLLFVRQGTLFAQNFDLAKLALTGEPTHVAENLAAGVPNIAALSASAAGPIIYRAGATAGQRQFVWIDRSGKEISKVGDPDRGGPLNPSLSPDGRRIALNRSAEANPDIWLLETTRGVLTRFTSNEIFAMYPIWSNDGSRIVFSSNRNGSIDLYEKASDGTGSEKRLLATPQFKVATDWSRDGRFLLFRILDSTMSYDIWAMPMNGDGKPFPVVQTGFDERDAQFAPDGKWISYQSNESGQFEIYVQSFPGPGGKERISKDGGTQVRWSRDGKELFYIAPDGRLMAVPVSVSSSGKGMEFGAAVALFTTHIGSDAGINTQQYMVSPDGKQFLMNNLTEEGVTSPITVILNWHPKH